MALEPVHKPLPRTARDRFRFGWALSRQRADRLHLRRLGAGGDHPGGRRARRPGRVRHGFVDLRRVLPQRPDHSCFLLAYRQPLVFFWTIPGTVLVGPALGHLAFAEVIGALLVTGLLMLVLGLSGWVRRAMQAVPMPIVMAMVAGVFLRFGLGLVHALHDDLVDRGADGAAFLALPRLAAWSRRMPPLIGALIVGASRSRWRTFKPPGGRLRHRCADPVYTPRCGRGRRWSNWSCRSRSPCSWCRTGRALRCSTQPGTSRRSMPSRWPAAPARSSQGWSARCRPASPARSTRSSRHRANGIGTTLRASAVGRARPGIRAVRARVHAADARDTRRVHRHARRLAMLRVLQSAFNVAFRERFTLGALVTSSSRSPTCRSSTSARRSGGWCSAMRCRGCSSGRTSAPQGADESI